MAQENSFLTMVREVCSLGRSALERPQTKTGNVEAARRLMQGLQALDPQGEPSDISLSLELLRPRAPYFDQLVLDAVANGITQIVNLGAGFDDRALRFSTPGVRFFDLDLPSVVAEKARRIAAMQAASSEIILVSVDFEAEDPAEALAHAGFAADQPSCFLAEHLMLFLTPPAVDRLFATVSSQAATGSVLALTAEVHPAELDSELVVAIVDEQMFGGAGPLHTISTHAAWVARFEKNDWKPRDATTGLSVAHFEVPLLGKTALIQTQFLTASRERKGAEQPIRPSLGCCKLIATQRYAG